jgi:hypothetical protein
MLVFTKIELRLAVRLKCSDEKAKQSL